MNQSRFRLLLIVSVVTGILSAAIDAAVPNLVPSALADAMASYVETDECNNCIVLGIFSVLLAATLIAATVGLYLFKSWSRPTAITAWAVAILGYPFLGPYLASGWAVALNEISIGAFGAAIAIAYCSPAIDSEFKRP
jgi:hypothetical protein